MANQNFVVHNGLTVGQFIVDATTSNISLPPTKQLAIGNVILRDNGDGKLHIRDITDNSDAELIGTVGAVSTTSGNIQIGTNHIESTNPNGPISLRPNGNGNIAFSSNTIMIGHGGAFTLVGTGIQTDEFYGINYPGTNIIVTLSSINSSGNLRLSMTTPASSTSTGALQVSGGAGIVGSLYVGGGIGAGGTVGSAGQVLQSTGSGIQWAQADQIANGASNVRVTANYVNVAVNGSNVLSVGSGSGGVVIIQGNLQVTGTTTQINSTTLDVTDINITVAKGAASAAAANGAGLTVDGANATILYTNSTDTWNFNKNIVGTLATASQTNITAVGALSAGSLTTGFSTIQVAQGGTGVTTSTGTGAVVLGTSPTLVTPLLGTPTSGTLTNCTGLPIIAGTTGTLSVARGGTGVTTSTGTGAVVLGTSPTFTTQITTPVIVKSGSNGVGDIGQTGNRYATVFATASSAQYADLAEKYTADAEYEPGTVVHFGGVYEVSQCNQDMCSRVAGVISTNPAYRMNDELVAEHVAMVALTGRVPCKVQGTVRKGDMMVSAGNGRARAAAMPQLGTVIGKALQDFDGSEGVIEVVVGRL